MRRDLITVVLPLALAPGAAFAEGTFPFHDPQKVCDAFVLATPRLGALVKAQRHGRPAAWEDTKIEGNGWVCTDQVYVGRAFGETFLEADREPGRFPNAIGFGADSMTADSV